MISYTCGALCETDEAVLSSVFVKSLTPKQLVFSEVKLLSMLIVLFSPNDEIPCT